MLSSKHKKVHLQFSTKIQIILTDVALTNTKMNCIVIEELIKLLIFHASYVNMCMTTAGVSPIHVMEGCYTWFRRPLAPGVSHTRAPGR